MADLTALFAHSGKCHPADLSDTDVIAWCTDQRPANNTIRNRLSRACTFLRWCVREGEAEPAVVEALAGRDNPLRRIPRLYGKKQGKNAARWLSHDDAFGRLLASCDADGDHGMRDELLLRLGLGGMRAAEIIALRVGNLRLEQDPPEIAWMGKGSRARHIVPGPGLVNLLRRYLSIYEAHVARALSEDDPVICRRKPGDMGRNNVSWGRPIARTCSVRDIVKARSLQAGLGHVSPHDLRRSAAGILHRATDEHGAHHFDLLDIQKVLGHSDPATTMRSYLDPMDHGVQQRAGRALD